MSLFPRRASVSEFVANWDQREDDDSCGEDLLEERESDHEPDERDEQLEAELFARGGEAIEDDEGLHKALDAERRVKEEQMLQALAGRYEQRAAFEMAHGNEQRRRADIDPEQLAARMAARRAVKAAEEAAERKRSAEVAAEMAEQAKRKQMKKEALYALYETLDEGEDARKATALEREVDEPGKATKPVARYRIKKKKRENVAT